MYNGGIRMTDKTMTDNMGGEVAEFIREWKGKTIECLGVCHKERIMESFLGYEHDGGLADSSGKKWWVYYECPKCHYGHSFAKMDFFARHTEIERNARRESHGNIHAPESERSAS
jgi:hypothetical protein